MRMPCTAMRTEEIHTAMKKIYVSIRERYGRLHRYSRDVIHGSVQFTVVLYLFAAVAYYIAPYTADYFLTLHYHEAALEIAPVTLAAGIVSALLCDLVLRGQDRGEKKGK